LQELADHVAEEFERVGLLEREGEHVALHAIVINAAWRHQPGGRGGSGSGGGGGGGRERRVPREPFDGSQFITKFAKFTFGAFPFTEVSEPRTCFDSYCSRALRHIRSFGYLQSCGFWILDFGSALSARAFCLCFYGILHAINCARATSPTAR
jgi:hypothetical protein